MFRDLGFPCITVFQADRKKHNRKIQPTWYKKYPWITVCTSTYRIFCVVCRSAYQQGLLLTFSKHCKLTFCTTGFNAWGKALERLSHHESSEMHKESVVRLQAKSSSVNIASILDANLNETQKFHRDMLMKLFSCIRYLARQGLPYEGIMKTLTCFKVTYASCYYYKQKGIHK